jgi:hypothetical protein
MFRTQFLCAPLCKADGSLHTLNQSSLRFFFIHPESPTARFVFIMSEPLTANSFSVRPESLTASNYPPPGVSVYSLSHSLCISDHSLPDVSIHSKALTARCCSIHRKPLTTRCLSIGTDSPPPPADVSLYSQITHRQVLKYTLKSLTARCCAVNVCTPMLALRASCTDRRFEPGSSSAGSNPK